MIAVSEAYKTALANDNRNFYCQADITFWNGDTLTVSNDKIFSNGFRFKEAVSGQSSFEIGACVIGEHTLILNNVYGDFDAYDFNGAKIIASIGLYDVNGDLIDIDGEGGTTFQKGVFYVDEVDTNGSVITLTCLDGMVKLDRNFSEVSLSFPATLQQIVTAVCSTCGVPYTLTSFPNSTYTVNARPSEDGVTCRDVLGMVCEIACCYATVNRLGNMTIAWFDTDFMQTVVPIDGDLDGGSFWANVDDADGGSFWDFSDVHDAGTFVQQTTPDYNLSGFFKLNRDVNDVRISGVRLTQNNVTYLSGSDRYTVSIDNNLLINAGDEAAVVADIASKVIGSAMRPFSAEHLSDPTIEAGDTVVLTDHLGNGYRSVITQTEFSAGERQRTECDAESYVSNQSIRYTSTTKELADYNVRSQAASGLLANAYGLYRTEAVDPQVGGTTAAVHNAETLETSTFAMIDNANGLQVGTRASATDDWTWTDTDAAEGAGLKEVLNVVGINADWIKSGTIDAIDITGSTITGGTITGTTITGGTVTGSAINNGGTFEVTEDGVMTLTVENITKGFTLKNVSGTTDTRLTASRLVRTANDQTVLDLTGGNAVGTGLCSFAMTYTSTSSVAPNVVVVSGGTLYRSTSSSRRYKHDINEELGELDPEPLYDVSVVRFKYNDDYLSEGDQNYGKDVIGFIAEDMAEKYPVAVNYDDDGKPEMWQSNYLIPAMLKLIQEQKKQIEALEARITALEERSK